MPILRHIYDSATGAYVDVEVTQEVYDFYRRNAWAIRRNNTRFYSHEIQFSSLIGGENDPFERFSEFLSLSDDPLNIICLNAETRKIIDAFQHLPYGDQHLLYFLIVEGYTEREYGKRMLVPQQTIHNRKRTALNKLKKLLEAHGGTL